MNFVWQQKGWPNATVDRAYLAKYEFAFTERAKKVILRMFEDCEEGVKAGLSASKWVRMAKVSKRSAERDLAELVAVGAVFAVNNGPQTRYQLNCVFSDGAIEPLNEPLNAVASGAIEGINEGIKAWLLKIVAAHPGVRLPYLKSVVGKSTKLLGVDAESGKKGFKAAAVLLLGSDDCIGDIFPAYKTDALLRRVNVDRYDDRVTVSTNLLDSYDQLWAFGEKHLLDKFYLEDGMRVSLRGKILREMIGNLLIHREFSSARYARLIIERDRMYTENANRAFRYGRITPKNLEPEPKNPIIANFFHQVRLADELGSGVRNLYHYVKIYSIAEPVFDEDDVFRLIVPLNDEYSADRAFTSKLPQAKTAQESAATGQKVNDRVNEKVNEESSQNRQPVGLDVGLEGRVLNEVTANPRTKMSEIAVKYHVSKRTVERVFGKLSQDGRIVRVGGKRFGHWEVIG